MNLPPPLVGNRFSVLQDCDTLASPKTKRKKNQAKEGNSIYLDFPELPAINANHLQPKFIVIKSTENDKPLANFSVFAKKKALDSISTEVQSVNMLRDGNLLVLTKNQKVAEKFIRTTIFGGLCKVSISYHQNLNCTKGTIFDKNLIPTPESEILEDLKSQGVVGVYKFAKKTNNKAVYTGSILLTFNLYTVPKFIDIAWYKLGVREYFPNPMRCKSCQKLGHTVKHCNNNPICAVCNLPPHTPSNCTRSMCANCLGPHPSSANSCPLFQQQKEILRIKTQNKCSMFEARRTFKQNNPLNCEISYATVIAPKSKLNNKETNNVNHKTNSVPTPFLPTNISLPNGNHTPTTDFQRTPDLHASLEHNNTDTNVIENTDSNSIHQHMSKTCFDPPSPQINNNQQINTDTNIHNSLPLNKDNNNIVLLKTSPPLSHIFSQLTEDQRTILNTHSINLTQNSTSTNS